MKTDNLKDEQHILNRQINYTIIRMMWDAKNKGLGTARVLGYEDDKNSLTGTFEISKYKWDSIVSGEARNIGLKALPEKLEAKTGIPKAVFTGEERIHLSDTMDEAVKEVVTIQEQTQERSELRKKLFKYLKEVSPSYDVNRTLYMVCYFVENKNPFIIEARSNAALLQVITILEQIKYKQLEKMNTNDLKKYKEVLQHQYKLAYAILIRNENT